MLLARFYELTARTRLGMPQANGTGRALLGAKYHLVDGLTIEVAAGKAGCTYEAVRRALKRIPIKACKSCGQPLPVDQATSRLRAAARRKRRAKASA